MNEIINFIWIIIKLLIIMPIAMYLAYISILVVINIIKVIIIYMFDTSEKIEIKDRFEETRKKDTELMLKRQGLYNKVRKDREEKNER
jgi:hypothetical protein|nr:MAG TPA: hypothetical protein [Caudoviricetes sp.]